MKTLICPDDFLEEIASINMEEFKERFPILSKDISNNNKVSKVIDLIKNYKDLLLLEPTMEMLFFSPICLKKNNVNSVSDRITDEDHHLYVEAMNTIREKVLFEGFLDTVGDIPTVFVKNENCTIAVLSYYGLAESWQISDSIKTLRNLAGIGIKVNELNLYKILDVERNHEDCSSIANKPIVNFKVDFYGWIKINDESSLQGLTGNIEFCDKEVWENCESRNVIYNTRFIYLDKAKKYDKDIRNLSISYSHYRLPKPFIKPE